MLPAASKVEVSCYTFGAPRTGNHAWARLHTRAVPDTWCARLLVLCSAAAVRAHCCPRVCPHRCSRAWLHVSTALATTTRAHDACRHIMNQDDVVTRAGKFVCLFKREGQVGSARAHGAAAAWRACALVFGMHPSMHPRIHPPQRVLINRLGDMLVRPTYAETAVRQSPGGARALLFRCALGLGA